jgi:hypothetical protein
VVGTWTWKSICPEDPGLHGKSGSVDVEASANHGGIIVHPQHPHQFQREDGSAYTLIGLELDWLWALELEPDTTGAGQAPLEQFVSHQTSFGFNHFLVSFYANFSSWNAKLPVRTAPKVSPTLNTPWTTDGSGTDHSFLNLHYFQHMDKVLRVCEAHGAVVHLMMYVGNKNVEYPPRGSAEDELWWRYALARFNAFPALLIDVSKEAGKYNIPPSYVLDRLALIKTMNPHARIVTSHSGLSPKENNKCDEKSTGMDLTMCSVQEHSKSLKPKAAGDTWYQQINATRKENPEIPVSNIEFMYERAPVSGCSGSCCGDCTEDDTDLTIMRTNMYDLYMAGASGAWYWCDTAWDVMTLGTSPGYKFVFYLSKFLGSVKSLVAMEPHDELLSVGTHGVIGHMLALPGQEYVAHVRSASSAFSITIAGTKSPLAGEWFDPVTGTTSPIAAPLGDGKHQVRAPSGFAKEDVVLHLHH